MAEDIIITEALEAKRLADDLIPYYHLHLLDARILYLFTTQERKKCDRVRLGSAKKFSALERYLSSRHFDDGQEASVFTGADFLIMIDVNQWETLSTTQRLALVDHELGHCARFEKITDTGVVGRWGLKAHDVEAFFGEIERHGLWKRDLQDTATAMKQHVLPLEVQA